MTSRQNQAWKCPVCGKSHANDWRLSSHIGGMACTYDESHREWANSRKPDAWQWDMGTAASMLRPFVLNEVKPEVTSGTTQTSNSDDLLEALAKLVQSRVSSEEETLNRNQSENDVESRVSNLTEGFKLIAPIEVKLHSFVIRVLKAEYGEKGLEWWNHGIPKKARVKCSERAEEDKNQHDRWEYLDFSDLKNTMDCKTGWPLFDKYISSLTEFAGKGYFMDGLDTLNSLRNLIMHPLKGESLGPDDFQVLKRFSTIVEELAVSV